ncbi:hypothetical protein [Rhizobium leguminosarum]|uniref:hypothetical protein n=1 Tax=Rhizobium leguminosarum TaxID=384 RepID=UPI001C966F7F|nr:hypothetical protein [Rhizobium leguminosarum]MBY5826313.1 hypothetical protein [Rhizobium leguminosarum]
MTAIAMKWERATDNTAVYDHAEFDHPQVAQTMCPWIEKLQNCPDRRWVYSVDVLDTRHLDRNGYPQRVRSLATGIVYDRHEAVAAVEEAIRRIVGGLTVVG